MQANREVYPRVYGGTSIIHTVYTIKRGLSPRVRGNQLQAEDRVEVLRSIPACTGEPVPAAEVAENRRVYPRVYGGTR